MLDPDRTELPTAIALPNNPFAVTNGSATLTVSLLNHNLQVGDFVLFFDGASNEPTQSFGLGSNLFLYLQLQLQWQLQIHQQY